MLTKFFLVSRQILCRVSAITLMLVIGNIIFQAQTRLWTIGSVVTGLCILTGGWVLCSLLIQKAKEKEWKGVSFLKGLSILVLIMMAFTMTSQIILAGENHEEDDARNREAARDAGIAAVIAGGITIAASGGSILVIGGAIVGTGFAVRSAYNWYKSASNCECANCSAPCSCSYPDCSNNSPTCGRVHIAMQTYKCDNSGNCGSTQKCRYKHCSCS